MADQAGLDRQVAHLLAGAPGPDQAAAAAVAERARRVLRMRDGRVQSDTRSAAVAP